MVADCGKRLTKGIGREKPSRPFQILRFSLTNKPKGKETARKRGGDQEKGKKKKKKTGENREKNEPRHSWTGYSF